MILKRALNKVALFFANEYILWHTYRNKTIILMRKLCLSFCEGQAFCVYHANFRQHISFFKYFVTFVPPKSEYAELLRGGTVIGSFVQLRKTGSKDYISISIT